MIFHATTHRLDIQYRLKNKIYNVNPKDLEAARHGNPGVEMTSDPFDTHTIERGNSWTLPEGAEFIKELQMQSA